MKPVYLYVTPFFPSPSNWRGSYCLDFVKALERTELYNVRVFVPGSGTDYEVDGVKVHRFATWQLPSAIFPFLFNCYNAKSFLKAVHLAGIEPTTFAVCHANTAACAPYALAAKRAAPRCLTLLHHHSLQAFGLNRGILSECWLHNVIQFPILRRMHEAIDCHVFVSEMARKSFCAAPDASWTSYAHYRRQMRGLGFYRPVRTVRSVVLHNGVDTSLFTPEGRKTNTGGPFTIGAVGNFEKLKGHVVLIEALSLIADKLGDWRLRLVGSGPEEGRIREALARRGLQSRVEIIREMAHDALPDFYRSLDLFVLPSFFEAFGCVYTEAYACGTPFIACAGQGMDDLVPESERGLWLAAPGDARDLAAKIVAYYERRPRQHLAGEIAIDPLVCSFLGEVFGA